MMHRVLTPLFVVAALCLLQIGCSEPTGTDDTIEPTFSSIEKNVFAKSCATSSCHGTLGQRGGLVLTGTGIYDNLVSARPENETARAKGLLRVAPGKPDSSFLIIKLTGPRADEGERMPVGNEPIDAKAIEAIRTWIANGAPRN